jgi:O-antigen ligase
MTYAQLCRSGYHYREYLVPLICGSLFAAVGYWGQFFGLPVISVVYQNAAGTGGELFSRVGSGRGDANDVALNLPLTIIGTIALAVFPEDSAKHHRIRLTIVAIVMCALCLPALGATFSRGGLYALPLGAVGLLLMLAISARSIGDAFRALAIPTTVFLSLFLLLAVTKSVSSVSDILRILDARNADNGRIHGESGLFVGREDVWRTHVEETLHYPFFGITKGETWDFGEYGMQTIGSDDAKTGAAAHNAFLEFGSSAGILGFCLFVYLFFSVPMQLIRRAASLRSVAPLIALVMMVFLGFMSLSAPNWKTYWVLLSIMIYCISINSVNRAPVRARSVVRRVGLFNSRGLRGMQPLLRRPIPHDPFND